MLIGSWEASNKVNEKAHRLFIIQGIFPRCQFDLGAFLNDNPNPKQHTQSATLYRAFKGVAVAHNEPQLTWTRLAVTLHTG